MKHNAKHLEIQFAEPESFALVVERAVDGERIATDGEARARIDGLSFTIRQA